RAPTSMQAAQICCQQESRVRSRQRRFQRRHACGSISLMHTLEPAHLLPGVTLDQLGLASGNGDAPTTAASTKLIRGQALVFWDPRHGGKKLDAIDTDQITPADDCVSE